MRSHIIHPKSTMMDQEKISIMMDQEKIMTIYRHLQKVGHMDLQNIMGLLTDLLESIMAHPVIMKALHHQGITVHPMVPPSSIMVLLLLLVLLIILKGHHHRGIMVHLMAPPASIMVLPLLTILKDHHQDITVLLMDLPKDSLPHLQVLTVLTVLPVDHLDMPFLDFQDDAASNINCHYRSSRYCYW